MGIENMRRWPTYIVFAVCILLLLSLFNSWSLEGELRNKIAEISSQLQECSKQQSACMAESLSLLEQRDNYVVKVNELDREKNKLSDSVADYKNKVSKVESKANHTLVDVELCKTELQSLKNLQLSKSAMLETLRLEKTTLTTQLEERKEKITELEKEIEKLKAALTTKSVPAPQPSKSTASVQLLKLSPVLNSPLNEPVVENAAKEEMEDSPLNEGNEFDPSLQ